MASFDYVIRDALAGDVAACLALDHTYETDYVWQMSILQETAGWQVAFRTERLPRRISVMYPVAQTRLQLALASEVCFLAAATKSDISLNANEITHAMTDAMPSEENIITRSSGSVLAYLVMRIDPFYERAIVQDIVVDVPFRRAKMGKRLLGVASRWAQERGAQQLLVQTQTKNYPAIQFCERNGLTFCGFDDRLYPNHDIAVFFGQSLR